MENLQFQVTNLHQIQCYHISTNKLDSEKLAPNLILICHYFGCPTGEKKCSFAPIKESNIKGKQSRERKIDASKLQSNESKPSINPH